MCHGSHDMGRKVAQYEAAVREAVEEVQRRVARERLLYDANAIAQAAWDKRPSLVEVGAVTAGASSLLGLAVFATAKALGA